jgi:segregation and condensation protein A
MSESPTNYGSRICSLTDTPPNEQFEELPSVSDSATDDATRAEAAQAKALIDAYGVNLDVFEGPLDLLLYLIRKSEVDIYDIPVAHITAQYLAFLREVHLLDLESAADFILMAATLMKIKSQMLLPRDIEGEDLDEGLGDPREELVRKLLEYQQFKEIADWLSDQGTEQRDVFKRPGGLPEDAEDAELQPVSLFDLLKVYKHVIDHVPQAAVHRIVEEEVAIDECIERVLGELHQRSRLRFHDLISGQSRLTLVATFIGILELLKSQRIRVHQAGPFEDIWIERREGDEAASPDDASANEQASEQDSDETPSDQLTSVAATDQDPVPERHDSDPGEVDSKSPQGDTDSERDIPQPAQNVRREESDHLAGMDSPSEARLASESDRPHQTQPGVTQPARDETRSDAFDDEPPASTALAVEEPNDLEADASRLVDAAERLGDQVLPEASISTQAEDSSTEAPGSDSSPTGHVESWEDTLGDVENTDHQVAPVDVPPPPPAGTDGLSGSEERS